MKSLTVTSFMRRKYLKLLKKYKKARVLDINDKFDIDILGDNALVIIQDEIYTRVIDGIQFPVIETTYYGRIHLKRYWWKVII